MARIGYVVVCVYASCCTPAFEIGTTAESPVIVIPASAQEVRVTRTADFESASYVWVGQYPATELIDAVMRRLEDASWIALEDSEWGLRTGLRKWWRAPVKGRQGSFSWTWQAAWKDGRGSVVKYTLISDDDGRARVRVSILLESERAAARSAQKLIARSEVTEGSTQLELATAVSSGDCRTAGRLVAERGVVGTNEPWHQIRLLACISCASKGTESAGAEVWGSVVVSDAIASFQASPRIALYAGLCWEALGDRSDAGKQYARAESLSRAILDAAPREAERMQEAREVLEAIRSRETGAVLHR